MAALLEPLFPVGKGIRLLGVTLSSLEAGRRPAASTSSACRSEARILGRTDVPAPPRAHNPGDRGMVVGDRADAREPHGREERLATGNPSSGRSAGCFSPSIAGRRAGRGRRWRSQWPQGTSSGRTRTASTVMPTTRAKPSCRSEPSGLVRNEAKLHAVIAAAERDQAAGLADRPDDPVRRPAPADSSRSRVIRKTL